MIGVSIKNDGTAPSGKVALSLQSNVPSPSIEIVKSDDIILGTIQNDSTCIDTPLAYQVNVSSSANEWDGVTLHIAIYENWIAKDSFTFILQVPPASR